MCGVCYGFATVCPGLEDKAGCYKRDFGADWRNQEMYVPLFISRHPRVGVKHPRLRCAVLREGSSLFLVDTGFHRVN